MNDQVKAVAEPMPKQWGSHMRGLGKDMWKKVDVETYIKNLRDEWTP